ncbi:LapA family protein [Clostridium sp.]
MRFGFIISLIFAILVALFGIQNSTIISINFFSTKFNISLALIIFISVIIGAIIVTLLSLQKEFTLSRGNKQLTKKAKNFETEIETSKNENVALTIENETFKSKTEALETKTQDLETKIQALETKVEVLGTTNNTLSNEINTLNIENTQLNTLSENETISLNKEL